ncbi:hypothetical protein DV735_g1950, partial [Chaetothyriales sp. CBS 134920]
MEASCNDDCVSKLSWSLRDAVTHSQALFRRLEDQTRTIESLRRANDELRREIKQLKSATPDITAQLDHFFQQDATKQAKIESLEADLRAAKRGDQSRALLANGTTSDRGGTPLSLADNCTSATASLTKPLPPSTRPARDAASVSTSASKRRRVELDDRPLGTLTDHTLNAKQPWKDASRDKSSHGAQAILAVTEDGQDHNRSDENETPDPDPWETRRSGLHSRLDTLLSETRPPYRPLSRTHAPAGPVDPRPAEQKPPSGNTCAGASPSALRPDRSSNLRFLHPGRECGGIARKNQAPLRGRPLGQLNLSHFRLNPKYTGYGTEEHTHGAGCKRPECCGNTMRAIAMSLAPDSHIAEDDLLLDFLGPGSEQKVATLTSLARENLLHEARVKRAAREYGKRHKTSSGRERAASPAGFWTTEISNSNEQLKICEDARQWERLEVEKRYHDAQTGQGKWVFADEAAAAVVT